MWGWGGMLSASHINGWGCSEPLVGHGVIYERHSMFLELCLAIRVDRACLEEKMHCSWQSVDKWELQSPYAHSGQRTTGLANQVIPSAVQAPQGTRRNDKVLHLAAQADWLSLALRQADKGCRHT